MGEIVDRITRKNQDLVSTLPLTISAQYGLIDQNEFFDKRVASKDVSGYYLINNGEFAYNKSTSSDAPWGAIKRLDRYENGVLSTLYIVFAIKEDEGVDSDYLVTYYDTDLWHRGVREIASEGARNHGLLNIAPADFFETYLTIPQDIEEQKAIGKFFYKINTLITLHQCKYTYLTKLLPNVWEQRKLDEWGDFYYGRSCPKWSVTDDATIPCVRYGELYTKFGAKIDKVYSHTNMEPENLRFSKGTEVLIPRVGEDPMDYNHCTWLSVPNVAIGEMISVFNTDNDPFFTATMFNATLQKEFAMRVEGGSVTNLYYEKLKNIDVKFPQLEEQRKIASYFEYLDNLITLHQCKCNNFGNLHINAWEQRKLGEMCQITMGQSPDGSTYSEEPSDYILVQGNADLKDGWVYPRIWTTQKTKTAQAGDLIMSVRAPAGAMGKTAYDVVLGRGVAGIKGNEFVYQSLVKMDSDGYWKKMAAGSTFESINSDVVKNAEMIVPQDIEEQEKIGVYFKQLDTLITLHQQKYICTKNIIKQIKIRLFIKKGEDKNGRIRNYARK